MTTLKTFSESDPGRPVATTTDGDEIASLLAKNGIRFERWNAHANLGDEPDQDSILAAYKPEIERLMAEGGYAAADVISVKPDNPKREEMRKKFLDEHTHAEDEVRFFVEGSGAFYLRLDGQVHQLICEKDDLLSVPAGTRHWFDMGPEPRLTCIRIFTNPEGWVAQFTGDTIASRFPKYE